MAERIGFEPTVGCPTPDFESVVAALINNYLQKHFFSFFGFWVILHRKRADALRTLHPLPTPRPAPERAENRSHAPKEHACASEQNTDGAEEERGHCD